MSFKIFLFCFDNFKQFNQRIIMIIYKTEEYREKCLLNLFILQQFWDYNLTLEKSKNIQKYNVLIPVK